MVWKSVWIKPFDSKRFRVSSTGKVVICNLNDVGKIAGEEVTNEEHLD